MRKLFVFFLVLFVDFASKYWVAHDLSIIQPFSSYPFGGVGVFKTSWITFSIVHTTNTGIAWGMLADFQIILLVLRIVITAAIIFYVFLFNSPKKIRIPLTLIAAGASGNILDYFIYGHVVDMFYFIFFRYSFPIFNVADIFIFLGVVYLFFIKKKIRPCRNAHSS